MTREAKLNISLSLAGYFLFAAVILNLTSWLTWHIMDVATGLIVISTFTFLPWIIVHKTIAKIPLVPSKSLALFCFAVSGLGLAIAEITALLGNKPGEICYTVQALHGLIIILSLGAYRIATSSEKISRLVLRVCSLIYLFASWGMPILQSGAKCMGDCTKTGWQLFGINLFHANIIVSIFMGLFIWAALRTQRPIEIIERPEPRSIKLFRYVSLLLGAVCILSAISGIQDEYLISGGIHVVKYTNEWGRYYTYFLGLIYVLFFIGVRKKLSLIWKCGPPVFFWSYVQFLVFVILDIHSAPAHASNKSLESFYMPFGLSFLISTSVVFLLSRWWKRHHEYFSNGLQFLGRKTWIYVIASVLLVTGVPLFLFQPLRDHYDMSSHHSAEDRNKYIAHPSDTATPAPENWSVYSTGTPDNDQLYCTRYSRSTWIVSLKDDQLVITKGSRGHWGQENLKRVPFRGGILQAEDNGEWGGHLWWSDADGSNKNEILHDNVKGFLQTPFGLLMFTGLAHLSMDRGWVQMMSPDGPLPPKIINLAKLDGAPRAFALDDSENAIVIAGKWMYRIKAPGTVEKIFPLEETAINSLAITQSGIIYLGTNHFIVRLTPIGDKYRDDWLVPPVCPAYLMQNNWPNCICNDGTKE